MLFTFALKPVRASSKVDSFAHCARLLSRSGVHMLLCTRTPAGLRMCDDVGKRLPSPVHRLNAQSYLLRSVQTERDRGEWGVWVLCSPCVKAESEWTPGGAEEQSEASGAGWPNRADGFSCCARLSLKFWKLEKVDQSEPDFGCDVVCCCGRGRFNMVDSVPAAVCDRLFMETGINLKRASFFVTWI